MSSPSDRPYKSRFFNFLNRHAIRIRDKAGVAWRNAAQNSVEWGLQILIYPVYLVVQAGRFAQRQLKQSVRNVPKLLASRFKKEKSQLITLQPPTERVLQAIQTRVTSEDRGIPRLEIHLLNSKYPFFELHQPSSLAIPEKTDPSVGADAFEIQGIVSLLNSHRLAVVSSENVVLDILTVDQQKALAERIRLEIANYCYERRLLQKLHRNNPRLIRTLPNGLPPIRWFWQIMRWEQTSDVAREINLFGESSLVPVEPSPSELTSSPLWTRLDEKISLIEEQDLISLTQWLQQKLTESSSDLSKSPTWRVEVLIRAAFDYFFGQLESQKDLPTFDGKQPILTGNDEQPLALPTQESFGQKFLESVKETGSHWLYTIGDRIYDRLPDPSTNPESDPFKIQVLLKSALEYFLEKEKFRHIELPEIPEVLPAAPQATEEDPWLYWGDLFDPTSQAIQSTFNPPPSEIASLPAASGIPIQDRSLQPHIKQEAPPEVIGQKTRAKTSRKAVAKPVAITETPQAVAESSAIVERPFPTSYDSQADQEWPDWVETKATATGYEKHFLERILGWFDRIFLWIEEIIIKIWNWFKLKKHNRKRGHR